MIRRLGFIGAFALILVPFMVTAVLTVLTAAGFWLAGKDPEPVLLNRWLGWVVEFPWKVLGKPPWPA